MKKNLFFSLIFLFNIFTTFNALEGYKYIKPVLKPIPIVSRPINKCSLLPGNTTATTNWAGYVSSTNIFNPTAHTVTFVQGSWIIPTIAQAKSGTFYSAWVGIDGLNNNTIEQLGTAYQFVNGKQTNYAWFEMYPKFSMAITNFPVKPGDSITASVAYEGKSQYKLMMKNNTRKTYTVIPASLTRSSVSPRTCCEWVVEAPSVCTPTCNIAPLAHFNPITFTNCKATIKGVSGAIKNSKYQNIQLNMATRSGTLKAVTSSLNSAGNSFKTTWKHS